MKSLSLLIQIEIFKWDCCNILLYCLFSSVEYLVNLSVAIVSKKCVKYYFNVNLVRKGSPSKMSHGSGKHKWSSKQKGPSAKGSWGKLMWTKLQIIAGCRHILIGAVKSWGFHKCWLTIVLTAYMGGQYMEILRSRSVRSAIFFLYLFLAFLIKHMGITPQ